MWTEEAQSAFDRLKSALSTAPVVSFPLFSAGAERFRLETDAFDLGIGATLFQEQDSEDRVVAYRYHKNRVSRNETTVYDSQRTVGVCGFYPTFQTLFGWETF